MGGRVLKTSALLLTPACKATRRANNTSTPQIRMEGPVVSGAKVFEVFPISRSMLLKRDLFYSY